MNYKFYFKKTFAAGAFFLLVSGTLLAQNARIKIDLDRTIGKVVEHGNSVEHLKRNVYGDIFTLIKGKIKS